MRARALHADAIVVTSAVLQVNCLLLRGGPAAPGPAAAKPLSIVEVTPGADGPHAESFLIDSPVLPEELASLPSLAEQARFPAPSGLLATHADWDHLLGGLAFPGTPLGCAESSAERLAREPGAAQRGLRAFDEELYIERDRPLALGAVQPLPVPGRCELGERELELHLTAGHTADGMAIFAPWTGVLAVGDYLSAIEIPMISPGGSLADYLATLAALRALLDRAEHVVPGHGPVLDSTAAMEVLEEDVGYLERLAEQGAGAELPARRRSPEQRRIHEANATAVAS